MPGENLDAVTLRDYIDMRLENIEQATRIRAEGLDRRLEGMNEFRESLRDQTNKLATRAEVEAACDRLNKMENWRASQEGKASQSSVVWATMIAVISVGVSIVGVIVGLLR